MKITIAYIPEEEGEEREAAALAALLRLRYPGGKLRRDKSRPGRGALYLRAAPGDLHQLTPCDLCAFAPSGRADERPCGICPAEGKR